MALFVHSYLVYVSYTSLLLVYQLFFFLMNHEVDRSGEGQAGKR